MSARIVVASFLFLCAAISAHLGAERLSAAPLFPGIERLPSMGTITVERVALHSALLGLEDGSVVLVPRHRLPDGVGRGARLDRAPGSWPAAGVAVAAAADGRASPDLLP